MEILMCELKKIIHHSSGWRPHPLGWGGKPAPFIFGIRSLVSNQI